MSTKIYDGLKLPITNIAELTKMYQELRNELKPILTIETDKFFANVLQQMYFKRMTGFITDILDLDVSAITKNTTAKELVKIANDEARRLILTAETATTICDYCREADFTLKLWIYPMENFSLAIPYVANENIAKAFYQYLKQKFGDVEYGYWDNSDRPENVSQEEWDQRENDWDKALPGIGIPKENSFTVNIFSHSDCNINKYYLDKLFPYFRSNSDIALELAQRIFKEEQFNKLREKATEEEKNDTSYTMKCFREANRLLTQHSDEVEKRKIDLMEILNMEEFFSECLIEKKSFGI